MTRLFLFLLSSLGVAAANPLTSDTFSKQFNRRQLPQCAGYGSVCRIDFTNHVNGSQGEFYTEDGDFCACPVGTCSTVYVNNQQDQRFDLYLAVATGGTSGIYICRE